MSFCEDKEFSNNYVEVELQSSVKIFKLKNVLQQLILPNFKTSDDTILQKLFDQINYVTKDKSQLLGLLIPWISYSLSHWYEIKDDVKAFILRVIAQIVNNSEGFSLINEKSILSSIHSSINNSTDSPKNCLILPYVDIVYNLIRHEEGINWIIFTELWKDIVQFSLRSQSIYVRRRSQNLLSNFIVKLSNNITLIHSIINEISLNKEQCQLINACEIQNPSILKNSKIGLTTDTKEAKLNSYKVLSEMLLTMLNSTATFNLNVIFDKYRINDLAWTGIHNEEDLEIILAASELLCVWNISAMIVSKKIDKEASLSFLIIKHLNLLIIRHLFPKVILETCVQYSSLWHKYCIQFNRTECTGDFTKIENLIFVVQAVPMFVCLRLSYMTKNEVTELFVDKLFKVACPALIRLCYFYRDHIEISKLSLEKLTCHVINSFIRVASFCEKEQAVMIFQGFMHLLKEFVQPEIPAGTQDWRLCSDNFIRTYPELLAAILSGLSCYLTKFKFSWRDSLETVCMMSFIQNLITNPDVPFLVCADALKLAKLVLLNFMPPNLALLVDTLQGSSMRDLGNQLFKTLGSVHWEVRDSTLEVLQVIGCLAVDKFPAFQSLLIEHSLPSIIVSIVESDSEPYVRASALTCLSELVQAQIVWDTYLRKEQVLVKLISLLYFETEGIVRNKAALLIKDICKYRNLPENNLDWIYDALYHIAQNDLHWEVKVSSLDFWDAIIEKCFISVGMVDGKFPDAIFSKEKKKIVQMTNTETCSRVSNAVNQLSLNGCLHTLLETLQDECDIEVSKKSAQIITKLLGIVSPFNIFSEIKEPNKNFSNAKVIQNFNQENISDETKMKVDNEFYQKNVSHDAVIDEIVAESDLRLLSGLVQTTEPIKNWPKINRTIISPTEFSNQINNLDVNKYLREPCQSHKYSWDIESLLDDILLYTKVNIGEQFDKNCIDCY